jgi:uncharacterized protein (TIGR02266 family)
MRDQAGEENVRDAIELPTGRADRRGGERRPIEVEVSLTSESQFFAGISGDISTGGLFVQTYQSHPVGTRVALALSVQEREIRATGVVRWVRGATDGVLPGVGFAFENLPEADRQFIEDFCGSRPALYHELED